MKLQERFEESIRKQELFGKKDRIIVAVSGGVDSVVLAELFFRSKFTFALAHCNFRLRGEESDADEKFVHDLAAKYNVPFFVTHFHTAESAEEYKLSIQETARKLRYDWFAELLERNRYTSMATAHHLNDSIETFFINLLRGTGIAGLRGIQPVLDFPRTIRPLLFAKKSELEEFASAENISFRLDHSNETDMYLRNRLRHHLTPVLLQLNPQFEKVMERNLRNLAFAKSILDKSLAKEFPSLIPGKDQGTLAVKKKTLTKSGFPEEMLMAAVQSLGFNSSQVEDIWNSETPGKQVFSGGYVLTSDRKKIILSNRTPAVTGAHLIDVKDKTFQVPGLKLSLKAKKKSSGIKLGKRVQSERHLLDRGKLLFPLTFRRWTKGDYFFPLGMTGRKKISDFLTDKKISRPDKEKTYVLLSGEDIVCVVGHRIDERYKVTDSTKEIYQVELSNK